MSLTELVTQCRRLGVAIMSLQATFYDDDSVWVIQLCVDKDNTDHPRTVHSEHALLMRAVWDVANQLAEEYGEVE